MDRSHAQAQARILAVSQRCPSACRRGGRHQGPAQDANASAGPNKGSGGARFARRTGPRDGAPEADDDVEFELLGQHKIELLIAEPAIGHDAHLDVRRQAPAKRTSTWYSYSFRRFLRVDVSTVSHRKRRGPPPFPFHRAAPDGTFGSLRRAGSAVRAWWWLGRRRRNRSNLWPHLCCSGILTTEAIRCAMR